MPNVSNPRIGAAMLLSGDFSQALGAGVTKIGIGEDTVFNPGVRTSYRSNAALTGAALKGTTRVHVPRPVVTSSLPDSGIDILKAILQGHASVMAAGSNTSASTTDTLGGGGSFKSIAEDPSLCIMPVSELSLGVEAPNAIWLPGWRLTTLDGINYARPPEGEITTSYNFAAEGVYSPEDQAATAIPEDFRMWFIGPPANLGLTWSVPADLTIE